MRRAGASRLLLLLLFGCDSEPAKVKSIEVADGGYREKIEALSPQQRDAVFLRAVRDAGHDCQAVAGSAYAGTQFGMPSWAARCTTGDDWLVMLDKGGRAHVARREEPAPPG